MSRNISLRIFVAKDIHNAKCVTSFWPKFPQENSKFKRRLQNIRLFVCNEGKILSTWVQARLNVSFIPGEQGSKHCAKFRLNFNAVPSTGPLRFEFVNTLRYHGFTRMHFFYCKFDTIHGKVKFSAWITPFTPWIWGNLIFFILISAGVLSYNDVGRVLSLKSLVSKPAQRAPNAELILQPCMESMF